MKYKELAEIALKMFGVYWLVKAATNLMQIIVVLPRLENLSASGLGAADIISWAFFIVLYAVLGYVLTFRTKAVLQAIKVGASEDATLELMETAAAYQRVGLFLLGVFFAVPAASALLPQLIKLLAYLKAEPGYAKMFQESYIGQEWPGLVENGVQFIVGVVLIMGRARLAGLWRRLRPLSTVNAEDDESRSKG